jgi:hypothetical protein
MTKVTRTLLFNDVVGSSRLWRLYPKKMFNAIQKLIKDFSNDLKQFEDAKLVKMMGDAFMISFNNPIDAVKFTLGFLNKLKMHPIYLDSTKKDAVIFRTGMAYGKVNEFSYELQGCKFMDFFGNIVNTASRMESKISNPNGFAFGIADNTKNHHLLNDIIQFIKEDSQNYSFKILKFQNSCDIKDRGKRSTKLLNQYTIHCESLKKLRGVDNILVLNVSLNN